MSRILYIAPVNVAGDFLERDHQSVLADLRDELISPDTARTVYGLSDEEIAGSTASR